MTVYELLPALSSLPRVDKLRVMHHLATELVNESEAPSTPGTEFPVWSPFAAYEAADTLLSALAADKNDARN